MYFKMRIIYLNKYIYNTLFGEITFMEGTMICKLYIQILNEKMTPILKMLGKRGILHDNDPKHNAKIPGVIKGFFKQKESNVI